MIYIVFYFKIENGIPQGMRERHFTEEEEATTFANEVNSSVTSFPKR